MIFFVQFTFFYCLQKTYQIRNVSTYVENSAFVSISFLIPVLILDTARLVIFIVNFLCSNYPYYFHGSDVHQYNLYFYIPHSFIWYHVDKKHHFFTGSCSMPCNYMCYKKKYHYIELLEWLSPTLDCNLIENMWNIMKRK